MKKFLVLTASLAATMMITACPGPNDSPTPSESPTPTESASPAPSESPEPEESASPTPSESPEAPEATPTPEVTEDFSLTTATATQQPRFRYQFTIAGTNLGAIADYTRLQVVSSGATVTIIDNGVAKNNVEVSDVSVTPAGIVFTWLPPNGAPTDQDLIKVDYQRAGETKSSTSIRLTVNRNP